MAIDTLDEKDKKDEEQDQQQTDHAAPLRADVMGSIAKNDPSSPAYLGNLDHYITAHGSLENVAPTMQPRAMSPAPTAPDIGGGAPAAPLPIGGGASPMMGPARPQQGWLGKIGHVAARMGNIAGDVLDPRAMALIPGTDLNKALEARRAEKTKEKQQELQTAEERAQAEGVSSQAAKLSAETRAKAEPSEEEKNLAEAFKDRLTPQAKTDFEAWQQQNPKAPVSDWLKLVAENRPDKNIEAKTLQLPDGKKVAGKVDSKGNLLLEDGTLAPKGTLLFQQPNYGQLVLPTKTTELLGPDNVMHRYQWNEETGRYDIDMGAAPTGTAAHQIFQAGAIEQLAPQVIADINANRDILGNLSSYYKEWLVGTPVSDPRAAQMMAELMSLAATQPALHAFRSSSALQSFEKIIGGLAKNPDSTIATIQGLMKTPQAFTNMGKTNTPPKGAKVRTYNPATGKLE